MIETVLILSRSSYLVPASTMKNTTTLVFSSLLLLLIACQEKAPSIPFDSAYGNRYVNLKRAIHKEFVVNDSLIYEVRYDRKKKLNTVRSLPNLDTVFQAHVCKFENIWVCSEPQETGGYDIWAFQKDGAEIIGWKERSAISYELQKESLLQRGKSKADSNFLKMNEEFVGKKLSEMLASITPQSVERFRDEEAGEFDDDFEANDDQDVMVSERLIHQIYPVPVNSILTLELIDEGDYNAVIYNLKGQQVFEQSFRGDLVEFNLESLENGKHILALLNNAGIVVDQESIYISH